MSKWESQSCKGITRVHLDIVMWHTEYDTHLDHIWTSYEAVGTWSSPEWRWTSCWYRLLIEPVLRCVIITRHPSANLKRFRQKKKKNLSKVRLWRLLCSVAVNDGKIVRKRNGDRVFWNQVHFGLKFVVMTQSASHVTQWVTLATGGNTKCTSMSAVPPCPLFTSRLYTSLRLQQMCDFRSTSKTTLLHYILLKAVRTYYYWDTI